MYGMFAVVLMTETVMTAGSRWSHRRRQFRWGGGGQTVGGSIEASRRLAAAERYHGSTRKNYQKQPSLSHSRSGTNRVTLL